MSDGFSTAPPTDGMFGLYIGKVLDNMDPQNLCRIRVQVIGIIDETQWAMPKGGGGRNVGKADVPAIGEDVFVQFVNGDLRMPVWERGDYGIVNGQRESFPEHDHPDVHVFGIGPFRFVIDVRESANPKYARLKMVKEINGQEQDISWIEINTDNAVQIYSPSAIGISSDSLIDIDAPTVQIKGRKIMSTNRPVN